MLGVYSLDSRLHKKENDVRKGKHPAVKFHPVARSTIGYGLRPYLSVDFIFKNITRHIFM